jgi:hypothetical protein
MRGILDFESWIARFEWLAVTMGDMAIGRRFVGFFAVQTGLSPTTFEC